jgi:inosose dehydratase
MHFKDVKNADNANGYEWVELGRGRVDLPGVIAALHEVHFRGWGVVELDRVPKGDPLTPKEANAVSLEYLREKLGMRA